MLATNGDPEMFLSANLTVMLYSPGAIGRYVTVQVPSLLSTHLISVFDGASMARDKPPGITITISYLINPFPQNNKFAADNFEIIKSEYRNSLKLIVCLLK